MRTVGYMKVSTQLIQSCHNLQEVVLCTQEMTRFLLLLAHSMARQRGVFHYMHKQEESVGNSVLRIIVLQQVLSAGEFVMFLLTLLIWPHCSNQTNHFFGKFLSMITLRTQINFGFNVQYQI